MSADAVIDFWFGPPPLASRREWFVKSPAFDESIRQRFGGLVEQALAGPLGWGEDAVSRLAEIVVLDQFPRNLFRGQARAFAGDARARSIALALIDAGADQTLHPLQRWFVYLPLEHAEDLALQDRSVAQFEALAAADPETAGAMDYAYRHRDVIRRFGRFPHRNAALGRASTAEELAYLAQPGSGF
jgi:uncharacterized protein (DUF924 family)